MFNWKLKEVEAECSDLKLKFEITKQECQEKIAIYEKYIKPLYIYSLFTKFLYFVLNRFVYSLKYF